MSGFIEIVVRRRQRGRPTRRRVLRLTLASGIALEVGDQVPAELVRDLASLVIARSRQC